MIGSFDRLWHVVDYATLVSVLKSLILIGLVMMPLLTSCDREQVENVQVYSREKNLLADSPLQTPVWVVSPEHLGSTLPPVGRSLFDYVFTEQQGEKFVYHIPFPFTALLQRLEQNLEDDGPGSPLKRVLIPINRSLQRHVSQPKYFAYPRVVVGIDTELRIRKDQAGMLLKDRLFK